MPKIKKFHRSSIGGNGFTEDVDFAGEYIIELLIKRTSLEDSHHRLSRVVIEMNKLIETMDPDLFDHLGNDILANGEKLNNLLGAMGVALDHARS